MAAAVGGVPIPVTAQNLVTDRSITELKWNKAPCRFCGTGCGVEVGVDQGKVVAVRGDEKSPVNRGLLCAKGYHLPGLLYGKDRLTHPMVRKSEGQGFEKISWDDALNLIANKYRDALDKQGPVSIAVYGSGQWTVFDGYAALKASLHALRDRIGPENAVHLGAQLPLLLRGVFYEGWHPAKTPTTERHLGAFFEHLRDRLPARLAQEPELVARAVFSVMWRRIDAGEVTKLLEILPLELRELWVAA